LLPSERLELGVQLIEESLANCNDPEALDSAVGESSVFDARARALVQSSRLSHVGSHEEF
jgi:hypothetical protein